MTHRRLAAALLFATLIMPCATPLEAQDTTVTVTCDPGTWAKTIKGTITGDAGANYEIAAKAGQVLQVLFAPVGRGACYMNVFEPGAPDAAVHIGSAAGNEFGASPTKAGVYRVQAYQMRSAARRKQTCRYTVSFELTGAGQGPAN